MIPDWLEELDDVVVVGASSSPGGYWFDALVGVVATVSRKTPAAIKVWPAVDAAGDGGGKIWFQKVEAIVRLDNLPMLCPILHDLQHDYTRTITAGMLP